MRAAKASVWGSGRRRVRVCAYVVKTPSQPLPPGENMLSVVLLESEVK